MYLKFKKEHKESGAKEGDVIKTRGKRIPKHLEEYVSESTENVYKKFAAEQKEAAEEASRAEAERLGQLPEQLGNAPEPGSQADFVVNDPEGKIEGTHVDQGEANEIVKQSKPEAKRKK